MAAREVLPVPLAELEALEQRVLPHPKADCCRIPHAQDAGGGHFEHLPEIRPACPEHSDAMYDSRAGVWVLRGDVHAAAGRRGFTDAMNNRNPSAHLLVS